MNMMRDCGWMEGGGGMEVIKEWRRWWKEAAVELKMRGEEVGFVPS